MSDDEVDLGADTLAVETPVDASEPYGATDGDVEMTAVAIPSGADDRPGVNDPFAAQVIAPAMDDNDEIARECGVCFTEPEPGQVAKLLCCRNFLCLYDAQRVGACPFCRKEPLSFGLE
jgi:hypothetical protein